MTPKEYLSQLRMEAIKDTNGDLAAATKAIQTADKRLMDAMSVLDEIEVVKRG